MALQSAEAAELLRDLPEERRRASWHLVEEDGTVRSAGAGIAPLLQLLFGAGGAARAVDRHPQAADRAYFFVATRRSTFGRYVPQALKRRADELIRRRS